MRMVSSSKQALTSSRVADEALRLSDRDGPVVRLRDSP